MELVLRGGYLQVEFVENDISPKELVLLAVDALEAKKGQDIIALDLSDVSPISDYFLICTGSNSRQIRSLADEVEEKVKEKFGRTPRSIEGLGDNSWVLLDYIDFVVHIFLPETREFYSLERLWSDARRLQLPVYP